MKSMLKISVLVVVGSFVLSWGGCTSSQERRGVSQPSGKELRALRASSNGPSPREAKAHKKTGRTAANEKSQPPHQACGRWVDKNGNGICDHYESGTCGGGCRKPEGSVGL